MARLELRPFSAEFVEAVEAWFRLSFGQQHAHGIREVPEAEWPGGVRRAEPRD